MISERFKMNYMLHNAWYDVKWILDEERRAKVSKAMKDYHYNKKNNHDDAESVFLDACLDAQRESQTKNDEFEMIFTKVLAELEEKEK